MKRYTGVAIAALCIFSISACLSAHVTWRFDSIRHLPLNRSQLERQLAIYGRSIRRIDFWDSPGGVGGVLHGGRPDDGSNGTSPAYLNFISVCDQATFEQLHRATESPNPKVRSLALLGMYGKMQHREFLRILPAFFDDHAISLPQTDPKTSGMAFGATLRPVVPMSVAEVAKSFYAHYWRAAQQRTRYSTKLGVGESELYRQYWEKMRRRKYAASWLDVHLSFANNSFSLKHQRLDRFRKRVSESWEFEEFRNQIRKPLTIDNWKVELAQWAKQLDEKAAAEE